MMIMMIAIIIMVVIRIILMTMVTEMSKKHTNITTFQQKYTNFRDFYLGPVIFFISLNKHNSIRYALKKIAGLFVKFRMIRALLGLTKVLGIGRTLFVFDLRKSTLFVVNMIGGAGGGW